MLRVTAAKRSSDDKGGNAELGDESDLLAHRLTARCMPYVDLRSLRDLYAVRRARDALIFSFSSALLSSFSAWTRKPDPQQSPHLSACEFPHHAADQ
jgi:hypothetical protein